MTPSGASRPPPSHTGSATQNVGFIPALNNPSWTGSGNCPPAPDPENLGRQSLPPEPSEWKDGERPVFSRVIEKDDSSSEEDETTTQRNHSDLADRIINQVVKERLSDEDEEMVYYNQREVNSRYITQRPPVLQHVILEENEEDIRREEELSSMRELADYGIDINAINGRRNRGGGEEEDEDDRTVRERSYTPEDTIETRSRPHSSQNA